MKLYWEVSEWSLKWTCCVALLVIAVLIQRYLRIIERIIGLLISLKLVRVLGGLGPQTVQFSLKRGTFTLHEINLKPAFVNSLDLPFRCKTAVIKRVDFRLPARWYGGSRAALLEVNGVEIEAITRRTPQHTQPELHEAQQARASASQRKAKLGAVEAVLWNKRLGSGKQWRLKGVFKRHFAFQIVRCLDVRLKEISLNITVDRGLRLGPESPGITPKAASSKSLSDAEVVGSVVSYRLRSFSLQNAANDGYGVLSTDVQVQGLSIDVMPAQTDQEEPAMSYSILRRWNLDIKLGWRLASGFFDRVAQRSRAPVVRIEIFAHALLWNFNAAALKSVIGLHSHVLYYYRYHQYRMLRPQVSVDQNPYLWWQHAGNAVLRERSHTLGAENSRWGLTHRRYYRQLYRLYYQRHRSRLYWLLDLFSGCPSASKVALQQLEAQLGDGEIAQFRWWVWASQWAAGHQHGKPPSNSTEVLGSKLDAVYQIMGARGKVRQKRSRPLRAQLSVRCPKISVQLDTGNDSQSSCFEVAMHKLDMQLLAGSQHHEQLQSGAGPMSIEASAAAFYVTHTTQGALQTAASSSMAAAQEEMEDLLTPWLVRSPPQVTTKELAPNFLTLKYKQPALLAVEAKRVELAVAQIDMVYSQYAFIRLVAFLNKAYPPPNLDPIMVRTSVTLNEIVRERLVGPKRPHQIQKHQESQPVIQVTAGDVRVMMPCGKVATTGPQRFPLGLTSFAGANLADDTMTIADEAAEPSFLVAVFSGFSVSTQSPDQRLPRPTRLSTLRSAGKSDLIGTDTDIQVGTDGGSRRQTVTYEDMDSGELPSPIPVSAFSAFAGPQPTSMKGEQEAWLRRRPGATFVEKLQIQVGLEAFLAKPDSGPLDFRDCAQVINPFIVTTKIDHCVEPTALSTYRRVLQVMLTTSRLRVEVSKFVKQEIHSLVTYMHSNLTHQQVTTTFSRHFAKTPGMADPPKSMDIPRHHRSFGSNVTFGDRRSTMRRVGTATTDISTQHSAGDGGGTEDGETEAPDEEEPESHYGLVLALQVHVPDASLDLVQSSSADESDDVSDIPAGLFRISFSDVQTTLAIDEDIRDMRFAVGSCAVEDLAEEAVVKQIIQPTPLMVDEACSSSRATQQRAFQAWRMHVAQKSTLTRRARDSMHHMLITANSQLSGHIVAGAKAIDVSIDSSLLHMTLEIGFLQRLLLYCCELAEAKPVEDATELRSQPSKLGLEPSGVGMRGSSVEVPVRPPPISTFEALPAPAQTLALKRTLSVGCHLHSMHLDVILEKRRFATIASSGMECSWKLAGGSELLRQLCVQCNSFQVLDRLCASHMYREALVCENRTSTVTNPQTALQIAIVVQNACHEVPAELQERQPHQLRSQSAKVLPGSPTAVQRLAKLSAGSLNPNANTTSGPGQAHASSKKHSNRRKKKAQPQKVVRVECNGLHAVVISRFLYDCAYFGKEVMAMMDAVIGTATRQPSPACEYGYKPILEVVVTDARVDVPRHSWSSDFYSMSLSQASVVYPATEAYMSQLKPDMSRAPSQREQERAGFATVDGCDWWEYVIPLLRTQQSGYGGTFPVGLGSHRTSTLSMHTEDLFGASTLPEPFHGSSEHNNKFHHWQQGKDAGVAIQLEDPKIFWCLVRKNMDNLAIRQVWDGGDIVANIRPENGVKQIWCPWVRSIFGELQYELLLGIFWENAYEPCSFGAEEPPAFPFGKAKPPCPPQTTALGVDKNAPPNWKFDVHIKSVYGVAEKLPPPGFLPLGYGPDLGRLRMQDAKVCMGEWPCSSWDITVALKALLIADTRLQGGDAPIYVVQIGEAEGLSPATMARLASRLRTRSSNMSGQDAGPSRWARIRDAVRDGTGPFAPPKRLARHASFAWDTSPGGSWGSFSDKAQMSSGGLTNSAGEQVEEGFFMEYVMQAAAPATKETPALAGPHVLEVLVKGAQLTYPLTTIRSFCHDIVETYSHYVYPPWVDPYPQELAPDQWMYTNVITENCQLFVPLPDETPQTDFGRQIPPAIENGLNITWAKLRLGQYWGGDGECCVQFNTEELSASGHVDGNLHGQGLISPFRARAEMRMHNPKDREKQTSISLDVRSSTFEAQPSFGQMPLFHTAIRLAIKSLTVSDFEEKLDRTEEFLRAVVFRPSTQRLNVSVDSLSVGLVDDRYGHHIKVLAARLQELEVKIIRDYPIEGAPADMQGTAKLVLDILFLNSAIDATVPMVESWPLSISYREGKGHHMASLNSQDRLNVILTPTAFRSLGDLYCFSKLVSVLPDDARRSMPPGFSRGLFKALAVSREKMSTLYRITNQSGLKLSYWVEAASGDSHLLRPFQSSDLHVEPVEKSVIMPDSQQHVTARTICMQFEGNWSPVQDIIVDKVGKYAYTIGSHHDTSITPVVMDVSLDIRTKVLTVHSPFRIENHTNHPLEFNVHLFLSPAVRDTMGSLLQAGNAAISTVPASPLAPGAQCYLPVPAVWGGLMYLHAVGWQIGKKDKIDLDGPQLKEKEGLYTCPPVNPGQKPFHCCLKVREEFIKVISKDGISSNILPEYVMAFQPPLVVHNVLPHPIDVTLADSQTEQTNLTIGVGGFVEVYQFDMSRKIRMSISTQDCRSVHSVNIHYPPSSYVGETTRKSVIADIPGLRLAKQIALVRTSESGTSQAMFGPQSNRLNLRLHNKLDSGSRAREVVVSCPYWIVNKTNLTMRVKDTTLNATQPVATPPGLGGQAEPVLFSTARGGMRVAVQHGAWSKAINLENLGLHYSFHVLGPPQAVGRAEQLTGDINESIMHFDCERTIAPRGFSPRKSTLRSSESVLRLVGRLGSMNRMDSVDSIVETPAAVEAEVTDPGHVLRRFNCANGGGAVEGETHAKRYEFAIETSVGPSIFHRTKVITILPRYVLFNNSDEPLQFGQRGGTLVWQLSKGVRSPFHWDMAEGKFDLCVRPAIGKWNWSGAFQIGLVGDYGLRIFNPATNQHCILPVEVSLNSASFLITVGKEAEQPPYRIENRCENVKVRFQQRDIDRESWESVDPGHSVDYAWEEPNMAHKLCVSLETEGVAFRDASEHEYNLDVIKAFPVVKLRRTNIRIVHKVANTVGRVMTTGINIANKSSSSNALQSQDQPELDARYVYVGVHADGPTRVLCFGETRDEYTRGTNEESVALLTQRLKSLEERNRDVDSHLKHIDEQQNIDMSLVMGGPTTRPKQTPDQMNMANRPSMRLGRMRTLSTEMAAVGSRVSISRQTSLQSSSQGDSKPGSPRDGQRADGDASSGPKSPNLMRRSLAIIKKVAIPLGDSNSQGNAPARETLSKIDEGSGTESPQQSPVASKKPVESVFAAQAASFPEATTPDSVIGLKPFASPSSPAASSSLTASPPGEAGPEGSLTALAFSRKSLAAQRGLSRFGVEGSPKKCHSLPSTLTAPSLEVDLPQLKPGTSEIQEQETSPLPTEAEARKGSILVAPPKLRDNRTLSLNIPETESQHGPSPLPTSPYDLAQPASSGLGAATLNRLKRISMIRPAKPRTIGSGSEFDAMLAEGGLTRASLSLDPNISSPRLAERSQVDELGNKILGGELVVKVWDAQGLVESWRKKLESQATSGRGPEPLKKLGKMSARGDVYCILKCEGQVKRTALAKGHQNPVWKEDIAFKSVQIGSELQVTLYGRARLGHDVFLGEVVIPLREVESIVDVAASPEIRRYILGRRNAKEKVSGEISLACSWRVTPLDVVTMKVKQQQAEVDHKEEILALLQEKYNIKENAKVESPTSDTKLYGLPNHKSYRVIGDQDPEIKRIVSYRGRLSVKVIEGKNIVPAYDLLQSFYTIDGYVQVAVNTDAGTTSQATRTERGNVAPVWNKMLTFSDVALGNSFTVSLFDHKKLSSDVLLGQASMTAMKFRNCKPHYLWLPLKRKAGDRELSVGELHLRVQWTSDELERPQEALPTWALDIQLRGVGLSVIEAKMLNFPREAMHALFEDIHVDFKFSAKEQSGCFAIYSMQIDNQLLTSSRPVVLSHDPPAKALEDVPELGHKHNNLPFVEVRWDLQQHNSSIIYFKNVSFRVQDMDLTLEEEFLELMVHLFRNLPLGDIWQTDTRHNKAEYGDQEAEILHNLQEVLDATVIRSAAGATRVGKRWYFENLDLQGIKCNLTLIPKSSHKTDEPQQARLTTAFGIHFMDINNVSLRINGLQMRNAFVTWRTLVAQIYRHLFFQALHEVHKILGQVNILGSPIVLGSNIFEGLRTFFNEPLKAKNPKQFARGIGKGSVALVKFSAFGFLEAIGQLTGGVSKGLALLTMDQEYVNRFSIRSVTLQQRLLQGVQALGVGAYEGFLGVIREPIAGWEDGGPRGLVVGIYMGGTGLVLKPVSGLLEFVSRSVGGAGEIIRAFGNEVTRVPKTRIRSPRQFMSTGLATGEVYNAGWKQGMMARLRKGRFANDEILDYLQNKDNKALVFTNHHLIYISIKRQEVRWSFSLDNLSSVSTSGLLVLLHHELTMKAPIPWRVQVHVPVRKRVQCRTRDLHQSLLVKLNRAQGQQSGQQATPVSTPAPVHTEPAVEAANLHILNAPPPKSFSNLQSQENALGSPRATGIARGLKKVLSGWKEGLPIPGNEPLPPLTSIPSEEIQPSPTEAVENTLKPEKVVEAPPLPEKKSIVKKDGLDHRPAPIRTILTSKAPERSAANAGNKRIRSTIQSAQVLLQAADRDGKGSREAMNHLRSIAILCEACQQDAGVAKDVKSILSSISDLCKSASEDGFKNAPELDTLRLLCQTALDALN